MKIILYKKPKAMTTADKTKDNGVYQINNDAKRVKIDGKIYTRAFLPYSDLHDATKTKGFLESPKRSVKIVKTDYAFYCYTRNVK
jgi:hypothetical protein